MKKKHFSFLASTALTVGLVTSPAFADTMNMSTTSMGDSMSMTQDDSARLNLNGIQVDQQPNAMVHMMPNGHVFASVEVFAKDLGMAYTWDPSSSTLTLNGQTVTNEYGKAHVEDGVALTASIRALTEAAGGKTALVGWDSSNQTSVVSIVNGDNGKQWAVAKLSPEGGSNINGTAALILDKQSHDLTVVVDANGFDPNSSHPEHIHALVDGKIAYPLEDLMTDDNGHGTSVTTIHNVNTIPSKAWFINIHQGPTVATAAGHASISKGDVEDVQQASAQLATQNNGKVNGTATLALNPLTNELTVVVKATGLDPNSTHPEHIHALTDKSVIYPLQDLKADGKGNGSSVTIIPNVTSIPANAWFINLHQGPDLSNDAGKAAIANGDVK